MTTTLALVLGAVTAVVVLVGTGAVVVLSLRRRPE